MILKFLLLVTATVLMQRIMKYEVLKLIFGYLLLMQVMITVHVYFD